MNNRSLIISIVVLFMATTLTAQSTFYKSDRLKVCYWDKTAINNMGGWANCSTIDYAEKPDIWEINSDTTIIKMICNGCPDKKVYTYTVLKHWTKEEAWIDEDNNEDDDYNVRRDDGEKVDLYFAFSNNEIVVTFDEVIGETRHYKMRQYFHLIR